ncbi:hypothetical protein BJF83_20285 [Nocardiopsis sp. CNR-923]|uniref:hypothetical protein n=1 Tax=Nocardiopsis sp. CNR-923 TaxID=1904965 RepID=UPI0009624316|nr:hypothetical protein [Nocardiopsis sp. CNR-923]OLT26843.1 hypothetical protein BJF83_20285 [Nocardiopsis sp. CNR-923]
MGWRYEDDLDYYQAAHRLRKRHGRLWLILWGPASRAYFAFFQGQAHVPPIVAATSEELHARIVRTERELAHPPAARS